jgi:hypothetical protein
MIAEERSSMTETSTLGAIVTKAIVKKLKHWLPKPPEDPAAFAGGSDEPDSPEDPYSYVGAPKNPRLPHLSASASAPLE